MRAGVVALLSALALAFAVFAVSVTGAADAIARALSRFGVHSVSEITPDAARALTPAREIAWVRPVGASAPALPSGVASFELDPARAVPADELRRFATIVVVGADREGALRLAASLSRAELRDVRILRGDLAAPAGAGPERLRRSAAAGIRVPID